MQSNHFSATAVARVEGNSLLRHRGSDELATGASRAGGEGVIKGFVSDLVAVSSQVGTPTLPGTIGTLSHSNWLRTVTQRTRRYVPRLNRYGRVYSSGAAIPPKGKKICIRLLRQTRGHLNDVMRTLGPKCSLCCQQQLFRRKFFKVGYKFINPHFARSTLPYFTARALMPKQTIFPVEKAGLIGSFFPINGIPELPNAYSRGGGLLNLLMANPLAYLPPQLVQFLQNLTPEQRNSVLRFLIHKQQEGRIANHKQTMAGDVPFVSATQVPMSHNPVGGATSVQSNILFSGSQHDTPFTRCASHEMLQSFMQLNLEG